MPSERQKTGNLEVENRAEQFNVGTLHIFPTPCVSLSNSGVADCSADEHPI